MKSAAKTPGKLLAGLCLILFFCLMPVRSYAAEQQLSEITKLYVTGIYGSETLPQQKVNWQYADKGYYLCMPSGADLSNVQLHFTENSDGNENADSYVMIGGQKINCGDSTDLSGTSKLQISLAGGKSVTVNIVKSAEIPAMFIQTASGTLDKVHASKDNKEKGTMALVKADRSVDFEGNLKQIKGRGNSTWGFAKKPYNIKLENSSDLLGMGKGKGWCLLANYADRSLLRNRIVYNLAEETGIPFTMDSRNIDLYINGDYMGSYLITEKIEIGKTRVNITDLEEATSKANDNADLETYEQKGTNDYKAGTQKWVDIPNDPEDITGGYLLELELGERYKDETSGFVTTGGQAVTMKCPECVSENQIKYISEFYQNMENALYSKDGYTTDSKGERHALSDYIDIESLARMYLLQEFSMNLDSGITSFYLYKDSDLTGDGKLHAALVWDFDVALGNYTSRNGTDFTDPTQWWAKISRMYDNSSKYNVMAQAVQHEEVWNKVKELWQSEFMPAIKYILGESTAYTATKIKTLDAYKAEVSASAAMNFIQWRDLMENPWNHSSESFVNTGLTYDDNIEYLRNFMTKRCDFLNRNLGGESTGTNPDTSQKVTVIEDDTRFYAAKNILNSSGDVRAEDTSDEGGGENLGYCNQGSLTEYKINVTTAGTYNVKARVASNDGTGAFSIYVDNQKIATYRAVNTGGWQVWTTTDAQEITLEAGEHSFAIYFEESGMNLNWLQFTRETGTDPKPDPKPDPDPDPTPTPTPDPDPDPDPTPTPTPDPDPTPDPNPTPDPTPTPDQTPNPTPSPKPDSSKDQNTVTLTKGSICQDAKGILKYRITKMAAKNGTAEVIGIQKKSGKVTIPSTITVQGITFKVTAIAEKAFRNDKNLKSVVIGSNVKKIGKQAFEKCKKLSSVTFKGKKAPTIGKAAFKGIKKKTSVQVTGSMKKSQVKRLQKRMKTAAPSVKITYKKKITVRF